MRKNPSQDADDFIHPRAVVGPPPWSLPEPTLILASHDVHIWLAKLNSLTVHVQHMAEHLDEDERTRAERFHFTRDRERYIVGRGVLRSILGRYLNLKPDSVRFSYGPHGKPRLAERPSDCTLRFNLAHSNELALYAFTRGREIGVDVEYLRILPDQGQIADSFFSPRENAILQALPASQRQTAFFNCWTRKEAYIKATGDGLSTALDEFDVSLNPGEPTHLVNVEIDCDESSRWTMKAFTPALDYVAALAVEGHNWCPTFLQFPESTS